MLAESIKHQIQQQVEALIAQAESALAQPLRVPTIGYRRAGKTGGSAHLQKNHINFNPIYLTENLDHYRQHVIPHEVAHIVVWQCFGKVKPHGKEWQTVMSDVFRATPTVTHNMQSSLLRDTSVTYRCDCGDVGLSLRRHNKVLRGQQYQCRRCNQILIAKTTT